MEVELLAGRGEGADDEPGLYRCVVAEARRITRFGASGELRRNRVNDELVRSVEPDPRVVLVDPTASKDRLVEGGGSIEIAREIALPAKLVFYCRQL